MLNTNSQIECTKNTQSPTLDEERQTSSYERKARVAIGVNLVLLAENLKREDVGLYLTERT